MPSEPQQQQNRTGTDHIHHRIDRTLQFLQSQIRGIHRIHALAEIRAFRSLRAERLDQRQRFQILFGQRRLFGPGLRRGMR